mmetsp:Transcript_22868/g.27649  ORF Transcript_22868/g.27649 Transcript_22868/m.27649 type:complete len:224 (-) Transcript_22868:292-963(-)|eukprot:CAMPEP_0197847024 /NCGR_PEP_ID=MMETSP1438-20131217/5010_1 /TAXON_ID=1461541 /ORGANISM="Pterosperma sp., Strain CCMP1384" /LENGTH=223 /DNA_ID=CAMNT_0043458829 /DNA_START=365 /DNA_END=1036 /DNA_ORIENTATION=+
MDDDLDWDDDDFEVKLPATGADKKDEVDESQFADEDAELEEEKKAKEETKPKTKTKPAYLKQKQVEVDEPLDDPVAEKARQQRLIEQSDFESAQDLFGDGEGSSPIALDEFDPQSFKDFEQFGTLVAAKYLKCHYESGHYAAMLKALLRKALEKSSSAEVKEVESTLIVMRNEKQKAEKPATKGKKALKKAQLNAGGTKGAANNDLTDALYDTSNYEDDYDFM